MLSNSIKTRLQFQHETIAELIAGFSEEQLKINVNPGKWSAFENAVHLIAYQPAFINRITLMLEEDGPVFERYVAENDPLFYAYLQKTLPELLTILINDRSTIINKLQNINEEQLSKTGKHPKYGTFTIAQWAEMFLLHEAHHLWTMLGLINSFRSDVKK